MSDDNSLLAQFNAALKTNAEGATGLGEVHGSPPANFLTEAALRETMERIQAEGARPHGTEANPHIFHPHDYGARSGHCIDCGASFDQCLAMAGYTEPN